MSHFDEQKLKEMNRQEFCLDEMQEAQRFDLSTDEIAQYFECLSLYINVQELDALQHLINKDSIEPLSRRQMVCSENAIRCLFQKNYIQALHETLDVLSDYNKRTKLNYNEYVVLRNILLTYKCLKNEVE